MCHRQSIATFTRRLVGVCIYTQYNIIQYNMMIYVFDTHTMDFYSFVFDSISYRYVVVSFAEYVCRLLLSFGGASSATVAVQVCC